jgi:uracil phosphoribosyltransferase
MSGQLQVLDHPLAERSLLHLRDATTPTETFRSAARSMGALLAIEATRDMRVEDVAVQTPLGPAQGRQPAGSVVAVPVLRSGLGLLEGVLQVVPWLTVGMVGLERDPETLQPTHYYRKLPPLDDAMVLILEPMLATGGSAGAAVAEVAAAPQVAVLSVVATRQAVDHLASRRDDVRVITAALDPELDENAYIVPGLGDFGDRMYGTGHESGLT